MSIFTATFSTAALLAAQNAVAVEVERARRALVDAINSKDDGQIQFAADQHYAAYSAFTALRDAVLPDGYEE